MAEYTPDAWKIVKITPKDGKPIFKVFASWRGGYLTGDSWKMNSGITKVKKNGVFIEFEGHSGSIYRCHENMYGSSMYTEGVLGDLERRIKEKDIRFEVLPEHEALSLKWV